MDGIDGKLEASVAIPETDLSMTPPVPPSLRGVLGPAAIVLLSAAGFGLLGMIEDAAQANQVFRDALVAQGGPCPWEGAIPCSIRPIPEPPGLPLRIVEEASKVMHDPDLAMLATTSFSESAVATTLSPEMWQSLVESGRPAVPGQAEALAGAMCKRDSFTLDGVHFKIVGKLQRGSSCLAFAYLVPESPAVAAVFDKKHGGKEGWIHPQGLQLARESDEPQTGKEITLLPEMIPTTPFVSVASVVLTVLVLAFGALAQIRFLRWLHARFGVLSYFVRAMDAHPWWLLVAHIICYGALVGVTLVAEFTPRLNAMALYLVAQIFSKGSLEYIGKAYLSGDILRATVATFFNNFVVETVMMSMLPSFVIMFWALPKTVLNLCIAGFAMAPLWTGLVGRLSYHSITMTLEIEAYVVATFAACVYPVLLWRGLREGRLANAFGEGVELMVRTTGLAGIMLLLAATYEAASIILFH